MIICVNDDNKKMLKKKLTKIKKKTNLKKKTKRN